MTDGAKSFGIVENAAIAIDAAGRIAWLGASNEVPPKTCAETHSVDNAWLTPALIDCHTHLVFAGDRAAEFAQRRAGVSYEEIARRGGGIMSTVNATRAASDDALHAQSKRRLDNLRAEGVATVEIKSGYGLNTDTELRLLEITRSMSRESSLSVSTTFLGAHAVPPEFNGSADAYVDTVCNEMLPAVKASGNADAVDAYCESFAFSTDQVARIFEVAQSLGFPVKLHADQLSDGGGADLAASFNALSADHLEYTNSAGVKALANAGTVAVLLPGAYLTLNETQQPPVGLLRDHDVVIAIGSDCNPGTSPLCSLRLAMTLAASQFFLTPEECLAGTTCNAARALGLQRDRGMLKEGYRADIAIWDIEHPRDLSYWMGRRELRELLVNGKRSQEISTTTNR